MLHVLVVRLKLWEGAAWGNMFVIHVEGEVEEDIIGQGGPFPHK